MKAFRFIIMLILALNISCTSLKDSFHLTENTNLLLPLGSASSPTFTTEIFINHQPCVYAVKYDGLGGAWASIPASVIDNSADLTVRYRIEGREGISYTDSEQNLTWLEENRLIDWKNPSILDLAEGLNLMGMDRAAAIQRIGAYIKSHIKFDMSYSNDPALFTASETLESHVGVCINFSRLFVALCRASGIPSRTVSGIVRDHDRQDFYDFHHVWMEYLDEENRWHTLDLTYSTNYELNDPRYADFVYGAEDHPWFGLLKGRPIELKDGNIILFHYLPIYRGARYGFELLDSRDMEYYLIEKTINLEINKGRLFMYSSWDILL